jgi:hypothetical protein
MPFGIFFIPKKYFWITKIIILFLLLTPLHWMLFDNECLLTTLSQQHGGLSDTKYEAPFTEKYLGWLFFSILDYFKIKKSKESIGKLITTQWIIYFLIIHYYIFYFMDYSIKK